MAIRASHASHSSKGIHFSLPYFKPIVFVVLCVCSLPHVVVLLESVNIFAVPLVDILLCWALNLGQLERFPTNGCNIALLGQEGAPPPSIGEDSRNLFAVQPPTELPESLEVGIEVAFAKGVDRSEVIAVLKSILDEALHRQCVSFFAQYCKMILFENLPLTSPSSF